MKATYKDFIATYENQLSDKFCDAVVDLFKKYDDKAVGREVYWGDRPLDAKDFSLELSQLSNEYQEEQVKSMKNYIDKHLDLCARHYINNYSLNLPGFSVMAYKIQKTSPGTGYHIWHSEFPQVMMNLQEQAGVDNVSRWAAYTIYLNDVEEGGETEFLNQSLRVPAKKGNLCIFPSYFTHLHRGNPPLTSDKYIITGWLLLLPADTSDKFPGQVQIQKPK